MADSAASLDQQPDLKKRARRRLVGAAALALLAAIVLPMVMDHEPRPAGQDIQVIIPAQDSPSGVAARILPGKPAAAPLPPPTATPPAVTPTPPSVTPPPETAAQKAAKAEAAAAAEAAALAAKALAGTAKAPDNLVGKSEKPIAPKPADQATAPKPAEKSAAKPAEPKAEEAHAAAPGSATEWVVQLGAYKETGNVKLLLSKLKGMGVIAYTEKFDSPQGPRTRVRAGPFATREAAEKARAKAKIVGVDGPVAPK